MTTDVIQMELNNNNMNFAIEKIKDDCKQNLYNLKKMGLDKSSLANQPRNTLKAADDYIISDTKKGTPENKQ